MNASYCDYFATSDPQNAQQRGEVIDTCTLLVCEFGADVMGRMISHIQLFDSRERAPNAASRG
jgi:hypothetical protein